MGKLSVAAGILGGSVVMALLTKSPYTIALGVIVVLYYFVFTSTIFTDTTIKLSGSDFTKVQWVTAAVGGTGIYKFQLNKDEGTAVWLSRTADTSQPAYVLFINDLSHKDSDNETALYQWDGSKLGDPLASGNLKTEYVSDPSRVTNPTLVNIMVYPTGIFVMGADYTVMQDSHAPPVTMPLYLEPDAKQYFILGYTSRNVGWGCNANVGFASSMDNPGQILNSSWLSPGSNMVTNVYLESDHDGKDNSPSWSTKEMAFESSWVMDPPGTGTISFKLNFHHSESFQAGVVVLASPYPGFQDKTDGVNVKGRQYYFNFYSERHGFCGNYGVNACSQDTICWEGATITHWDSDDSSSGVTECAAWAKGERSPGSRLYRGWKKMKSNCNSGKCSEMHGTNCRVLGSESTFSGKSGCCDDKENSEFADYHRAMWDQHSDSYIDLYVQLTGDTMGMGFIDSNGNAQPLVQGAYTPDKSNPVKYWGFAVVGLGHDDPGPNICRRLHDYHNKKSEIDISNIQLKLPN